MGGYGSGPYGHAGSKTAKLATGRCYSLDIRRLKRDDLLKSGMSYTWSWHRDGKKSATITIRVISKDKILLEYTSTINGEPVPVEESVYLNGSDCNYGGQRLWFSCPRCQKRVALLYLKGHYFRCRKCHDLSYYSCQESGNFNDMSIRHVNTVLSKLKSEKKYGFDILYHTPRRPRYMHFKTYQRLMARYADKQMEYAASVRAKVESFGCNARHIIDLPEGF